jgi:hypothetical protein
MMNLAGLPNPDPVIERELTRCRIEVVRGETSKGEVATSLTGRLGPFTFRRAWYYWIVSGRVPLAVADELYADPVGVTDVRVGGDCGCPDPRDYTMRFVDDVTQGHGSIETYHIDSEVGLRLFADAIRRHGLDKSEDIRP